MSDDRGSAPMRYEWGLIGERYASPRVLRTRSGSPFRVRSSDGAIVVTPSSGYDRSISEAEVRSAWPFIRDGIGRSKWKPNSSNSGYLESIFDDIADWQPPDGPSDPSPYGGIERRADPAAIVAVQVRLAARDADLAEATTRLVALETENRVLRERIESIDQAAADIGSLEVRLDQERRARAELELALGTAHDDLAVAMSRISKRSEVIKGLRTRLEAARAEQPRTDISPLPGGRFELVIPDGLLPDLAKRLEDAAKRVFIDPDASVAECRRVLEASARTIWEKSHGLKLGSARRFVEVMADLRESPSVPPNDWHLAKNIHSRASSLIHEGGATPQASLWVWLGTVQVAQLASNPIVTTRHPAPAAAKESGPMPGAPQGYPSTSRLTDARWQVKGSPGTRRRQ